MRRRFLFVCGKNRWRSPTAEQIFASRVEYEVLSAGLAPQSDTVLDAELVAWADRLFVMENRHRKIIEKRFGEALRDKRIVCLRIPDRYRFMDPELVDLLNKRMVPHLA